MLNESSDSMALLALGQRYGALKLQTKLKQYEGWDLSS